jgi:galactokinase
VGNKEKVTLREVLGRMVGENSEVGKNMDLAMLRQGLERMVREVESLKPARGLADDVEEGFTFEEMIEWSGLSEDVFREVYLSWVDGTRKLISSLS